MEVHAPNKPILSWKEAVVHLCIVTVGILIALSLDGILESVRHRALVREARATLTAEVQSNRTELEHLIGELGVMQQHLEHGITVLDAVSADRQRAGEAAALFGSDTSSVIYSYDLVELNSASRTTAEMTGAFGLMSYAEVQKFTAAYHRQELYDRVQDQAFNSAMAAFSLGHALNFQRASVAELEDVKSHLRLALGSLIIERDVAAALSKAYAKALPPK